MPFDALAAKKSGNSKFDKSQWKNFPLARTEKKFCLDQSRVGPTSSRVSQCRSIPTSAMTMAIKLTGRSSPCLGS